MKKFYIYKKSLPGVSQEDFCFIPVKVNLWAFMFNALWLVFRKCWLYFAFFLCFILLIKYFVTIGALSENGSIIVLTLAQLLLAFEAPFIIERKLVKSGYSLEAIIYGRNEQEAQVKFFESQEC